MFDIGWSELLLIGVVALIAIGPKELPGALRTLGQWMAKVRRMAAEFQGQFQEAMREAEVDQLRKDMDEMAAKTKSFDPLEDMRRDIERTIGDPPSTSNQPTAPAPEVATAPPAPDTPAVTLPAPATESATPSHPAAASDALPPDAPPVGAGTSSQAATTHAPAQPSPPEPAFAGGKPDAGRTSA